MISPHSWQGGASAIAAFSIAEISYVQGQGISISRTTVQLQERYNQYLAPSVTFEVTNNVIDITGEVRAGRRWGSCTRGTRLRG